MNLTVNLGEPYERIIERAIKNGHAGSKSEVLRQALKVYERQLRAEKAEEDRIVAMMVNEIVDDIESGKKKGYTLKEMRKIFADKIDK